MGNVLVDQDSVADRNEIVVAANDERRCLDGVELGKLDVRLLPVEKKELAVVLFPGSAVSPVNAGVVLLLFAVPESGLESIGRRPQVGAGRGKSLHFFWMPHGQ
jgi:hypothetical protein